MMESNGAQVRRQGGYKDKEGGGVWRIRHEVFITRAERVRKKGEDGEKGKERKKNNAGSGVVLSQTDTEMLKRS